MPDLNRCNSRTIRAYPVETTVEFVTGLFQTRLEQHARLADIGNMSTQAVEHTEVVVIGGGQAGLAVSFLLSRSAIDHVVLERGAIGESWRSQRWDSFYLNTPNWSNGLPGMPFHPEAVDAFAPRDQIIAYLENYAQTFRLPVRPNTPVTAVEKSGTVEFAVQTPGRVFRSRAVVLASGSMSRPRVPAMAKNLPVDVLSLSAGTYRTASELPAGAVVVVGTGQSGCQIAEDLLGAGRRVYVCASRVARCPRTYRGRDIVTWFRDLGIFDVRLDELEDPAMQYAAQPQVSGTDGGHTVSLQSLARDGATLLGRISGVQDRILKLESTLAECIAFADERASYFRDAIDQYIAREGIQAAPATDDPGEPELVDLGGSDQWDQLDLGAAGVTSIIWCTGFDADWSWVKIDVFDDCGRPRHRNGITDTGGLYFVGIPWLSKRKSGVLYGVSEDAERISRHIESYLGRVRSE